MLISTLRFRSIAVLWFQLSDDKDDGLSFEEEALGTIQKGTILGSVCMARTALRLTQEENRQFLALVTQDMANDDDMVDEGKKKNKKKKLDGRSKEARRLKKEMAEKQGQEEKEESEKTKSPKKAKESPKKTKAGEEEDSPKEVREKAKKNLEQKSPKKKKLKATETEKEEKETTPKKRPAKRKREEPTPTKKKIKSKKEADTTSHSAGEGGTAGTPTRATPSPSKKDVVAQKLPEGWRVEWKKRTTGDREDVYYTSPQGKVFNSMKRVQAFIRETEEEEQTNESKATPTKEYAQDSPKAGGEGKDEVKGKRKRQRKEKGTSEENKQKEQQPETTKTTPTKTTPTKKPKRVAKKRRTSKATAASQDSQSNNNNNNNEERCKKCHQVKEGHICPFDSPNPSIDDTNNDDTFTKEPPALVVIDLKEDDADSSTTAAQQQPEEDGGMLSEISTAAEASIEMLITESDLAALEEVLQDIRKDDAESPPLASVQPIDATTNEEEQMRIE